MDRIRALFSPKKGNEQEYEPLTDDSGALEESEYHTSGEDVKFSWLEYSIFALVGVAMLWAWNMFLAAAPYFQTRFSSNEWMLENSQSAILSVSTVTNLAAMLILTNLQSSASYPFRICTGLAVNIIVFGLLTITTKSFLGISAPAYFGFLLFMVSCSAWGTGLIQNGAFAFAASFGRPEYTQAIMAGQGVAGVLPPLVQMISVLVAPPPSSSPDSAMQPTDPSTSTSSPPPTQEASTAAFIYFLTAVIVSLATLAAFVPLVRRYERQLRSRAAAAQVAGDAAGPEDSGPIPRRYVSIPTLLRKLRWSAAAVFMCFVVAMFFPVFTSKILSVRNTAGSETGGLFSPGVFIPLGFFMWNLGDLAGRVSTMLPFSLRHRPAALFAISLARLLFLPLYLLCNIRGRGAVVPSDAFYLLAVQFPFGLTNGWLGSSSMMAAGEWVDDGEREAAGGFMGLCLVAGLTVGSLLSFTASGV